MVELAGWLVRQKQTSPGRKRPRQRDALGLATREFLRYAFRQRVQLEAVQRIHGRRARCGHLAILQQKRQVDVFDHRQGWQQTRRLKHIGDLGRAQRVARSQQWPDDAAGGWLIEPAEQVE